jgi:hypothetical protein
LEFFWVVSSRKKCQLGVYSAISQLMIWYKSMHCFGLCVNLGKIQCCAVTWIFKELSVSSFYIFQNQKTTSSGSLKKIKIRELSV